MKHIKLLYITVTKQSTVMH